MIFGLELSSGSPLEMVTHYVTVISRNEKVARFFHFPHKSF
jgi:hypothetical protein